MDRIYVDTVRLLLRIAPEVFHAGIFAIKGGTAINLFIRDMPRLSVDIDLVYVHWDVPREEALQAINDEIAAIAGRIKAAGIGARPVGSKDLGNMKLIAEDDTAQAKIEVNAIFRGTVLPV
jgi:hypothetical protein